MLAAKSRTLALALFAWTMIGADKCTGWGWTSDNGSAAPPPTMPAKPYCHADPPYGCAALCVQAGADPTFTDNCADIGAGPLTAQFKELVLATSQASEGGSLCTADNLLILVTPCSVGIVPKQLESNDGCMAPPTCG
jgi:hypothetical protein